jgi:hypothetical protein
MATEDSSNATPVPQMTPEEMRGFAARLRARAQSVLLRDQPEQQRDLLTAANLLEQLAQLRGDIQRLADEVKDEAEQQHLRGLLEGL